MVIANKHYLRYALATTGPKDVKDLARGITKLGVDVLAACTVTKSLDGRAEAHVTKGTMDPTQLMDFIDLIRREAAAICTAYQLSQSHSLRFTIEAIKMMFMLLKTACNSGRPFREMEEWTKGRLTDPAAALPTPSALFALTHVTGTAQMSAVLTRERGSVTLVSSSGKLQYELFLSHIMKWTDKHLTILGFRPTEPLMQEWILGQICSDTGLFYAKQRDPKMTNPTSTEMIAFLYTQRDLLF
jgi:hypothetical protein